MKIGYNFLILFILSIGLASCEYDNYDAPSAKLQGNIVYNGEPIGVAVNEVNFELWEPGWQLKTPINVTVAQDGSYSASLFNATYKLTFRPNQGPFRMVHNSATDSDTILVDVSGNTVLDIEVEPYYMIRNPQFSLNGNVVTATAGLEQIITGEDAKNVEQVSLFLNKTQFVDQRGDYNLARTDIAGADIADMGSISLSTNVPDLVRSQSYIYARIGVKIEGVEDMLYSPVQQLAL
ncbi:DUF3823 domain-containing protein [Pontibacter russatus]|uniref:DUF3823 domain-containing protein n=1 Tax=Pontibacter russatus TaxID=2694929 RepID=UPI001379F459|nr:DUF3823 domain-containing protein [Pontibacter russatus]